MQDSRKIKEKHATKFLIRSYYSSGMQNVAIYTGLLTAQSSLHSIVRVHTNTQTGTTLRHLNPVTSHHTNRRYILISPSYLCLGHRSGSFSMRFTDPNVVFAFNPAHVAYPKYPVRPILTILRNYKLRSTSLPNFFTMNIRSGFGSHYKRLNAATNTLHSRHNSHDMAAI